MISRCSIRLLLPLLSIGAVSLPLKGQTEGQVWLDSLDLKNVMQGYGSAKANTSVEGSPLKLGGTKHDHGVGTHSLGYMMIDLHGEAASFQALAGVDDDVNGKGSLTFTVLVDGKKAAETKVLHGGDAAVPITVDLKGAQKMLLIVGDAGDGNKYDHADWADAAITMVPNSTHPPETAKLWADQPPRMTVPEVDPKPEIHGAKVIGSTPGRPFLFPIAATGTAPLHYAAQNLPQGLQIDSNTGVISGSLAADGTIAVTITVSNTAGTASRELSIVGGKNKLALTPPMGWNSWNVWAREVDEGKIKAAADEMISTGLMAHGYNFVNIDDCWQGKRDLQGILAANGKFTDMKAMCDDLHARGFKAGIYSSPGPQTCAGYTGSLDHEQQDAETYAKWGFDYLKYDLCSYGNMIKDHSEANVKPPYAKMYGKLNAQSRDIVYSLCEYGDGEVWKWGADPEVQGNLWRTYTDIDDVFTGSSGWGSNRGVYNIIEAQLGLEKFAGPGHWNDPDMLMVGLVGFGHPHPTQLTKNEQILHISMWSMMAAPLIIGCDLTKLDDFTKAVLTNDEILDIDQDPLGQAAGRVAEGDDGTEVWSRPLADGTHAVALMNPTPIDTTIAAKWTDIGVTGEQPVRDLWLHQNVGSFDASYSVAVPAHSVAVVKIGTAK